MSSVNFKYPDRNKTKEVNCWNNSGHRQQSYVTISRNWVCPNDSNMSYSKATSSGDSSRSTHNKGRDSPWNKDNTATQFINDKTPNHWRLSKDNHGEESTSKENSQNKDLKILHDKYQSAASSGEPLSSIEVERSVNNPHASSQSVQGTADSTNYTASFTENVNEIDFESNLEEKRQLRRERQKVKKEMKKQEKAVLREEEMRKKRLAPKDQKVTIIDHSMLERLLVKETSPVNVEAKCSMYSGSEFPALGEVTYTPRSRSTSSRKKFTNKGKRDIEKVSFDNQMPPVSPGETNATQKDNRDQSINSRNIPCVPEIIALSTKFQEKQGSDEAKCTDDSKQTVKSVDDKAAGKRPKRRDPIHLDITEILKVKETKLEVSVRQHTTKPLQKVEAVRYAGNILDSDNPERKRGKQREVPKPKRPSSLKQIILQERAKRKEAHLQDTFVPVDSIDTKEGQLLNDKENPSSDDAIVVKTSDRENKSIDGKDNESSLPNSHDTNFSESNDIKDDSINFQLESIPVVKINAKKKNIHKETELNENHIDELNNINFSNEEVKENSVCLPTCQKTDEAATSKSKANVPRIHSRKFREYCDHFITPEILNTTTSLLEDIVKFHDRQFARSPLKASAKRRHVTGLKEVRRFLALRRVRLLVIAPDLEQCSSSGGLNDLVAQLKGAAVANEVPYIFALNRRHLGYILKKKVPVSCVGVLNYDGTEQNFRKLMSAVEQAREEYRLKVPQDAPETAAPSSDNDQAVETPNVDVNKEVVASLLAKLSGPRKKSSFLQAIEHCSSVDSDSDDSNDEE